MAIQVVMLLLLLAILAAVVFVFFSVASLTSVPSQLGGVGSQASRAVTSAQQAVQSVVDPNHPPLGLAYDTEFAAIDTWKIGDGLPGGTQYVLTLKAIQRRDGAQTQDTALYATIHAELRQPHETRVLGQVVHTDSDAHDYVIYKGEAFRIGSVVYRVNWISQETGSLGAGVLRNPDTMTQPLKFEYP
jgi:hypothetical protein